MTKRREQPPATVPPAQQAGTDHPLWRCAHPCVWTPRMLTTLIAGVEGGTWFRLFDKVFAERNLLASFQQVAINDGAPGVDHVTCEEFERQLPDSIWELADRLQAGTFAPQAIRRVHIPKPGSSETRPLGIPTVRDRVVQAAIVHVIEPIFERDFAEQSYGFRPGRGCQDALRRVDELVKSGYTHVVDADLKGYFDTIPHERLMTRLREKIADGALLRSNGQSLQYVIARVNQTLRGWFAYFQHSLRTSLQEVDQWIRQRLRGILRKRLKRRGRARGKDFKRWPNAFFAKQGLYCLVTAHVAACQSLPR